MWDHQRHARRAQLHGHRLRRLPLDRRRQHVVARRQSRCSARTRSSAGSGVAIDPQNRRQRLRDRHRARRSAARTSASTSRPTSATRSRPTIDPDNAGLGGAFVYGWWFGRLWVDPDNSQRIYSAGVDLMRSRRRRAELLVGRRQRPRRPARDGLGPEGPGARLPRQRRRALPLRRRRRDLEPRSSTSRSASPTASTSPSRTRTALVAGLQDNGQIRTENPAKEWNEYGGGDGQRTLISPKDKKTSTGARSTAPAPSPTTAAPTRRGFTYSYVSTRHNWFTPIEFDPEDPRTIYIGGDFLSRSDDEARELHADQPGARRTARAGDQPAVRRLRHAHDDLAGAQGDRDDLRRHRQRRPLVHAHRRRHDRLDPGDRPRPAQVVDHARAGRPEEPEGRVRDLLGHPRGARRPRTSSAPRTAARTGTTSPATCRRSRYRTST